MHVVSTNFAKTLVCKREYDVILWRISNNKTTIPHCLILKFRRGASNQAVVPVITRPLHATSPCLVSQRSHLSHWPCHQWRLANCDWMPASYPSWQYSHSRRHPACWSLSQWSHTVSSSRSMEPWHLLHSAITSIKWECTASEIETSVLFPLLNNSSVHLITKTETRWNAERLEGTKRLWIFIPDPPSWNGTAKNSVQYRSRNIPRGQTNLLRFSLVLDTNFESFGNKRNNRTYIRWLMPWTKFLAVQWTAWVWLNRLRTGIGCFCSCLYKWGMATSVACECGAEDQTIGNVVF